MSPHRSTLLLGLIRHVLVLHYPSVEDVYRLLLNRYFLKYHHLGIQCRHVTIASALLPISVVEYLMASNDISRFAQHRQLQDKKWTTSNIFFPKSTASLNDSLEKSLSFQRFSNPTESHIRPSFNSKSHHHYKSPLTPPGVVSLSGFSSLLYQQTQ